MGWFGYRSVPCRGSKNTTEPKKRIASENWSDIEDTPMLDNVHVRASGMVGEIGDGSCRAETPANLGLYWMKYVGMVLIAHDQL